MDRLPVYPALSALITKKRKERGLNRAELARKISHRWRVSVPRDSIKVIETGMHKSAPRRTMEMLCVFLDIEEMPPRQETGFEAWWVGVSKLVTLSDISRAAIQARRKSRGLTQADMARKTGMCATTYRFIEGATGCLVDTAKVARVLRVLEVRPSLNLGSWARRRGLVFVGPSKDSAPST
jgi:DNA-binding XRE family transcriptional regulator